MTTQTREQAAEAGLSIYRAAKRCRRCRGRQRYTSSGHCVRCHTIAMQERSAKLRDMLRKAREAAQQPAQSTISDGGLPPQAGTGSGRRSAPSKTGGES